MSVINMSMFIQNGTTCGHLKSLQAMPFMRENNYKDNSYRPYTVIHSYIK